MTLAIPPLLFLYEELLRAGIHVISTLNIQHLESLHDIVEQATGVRVKERIPDYVVSTADQLVNVDLSAEDLRERLQSGKIYPPDRINLALENFFQLKNLNQLRELAMKEIVLRLGRLQPSSNEEASASSERVMAALGLPQSECGAILLRKAARLADRFGAPWYAVYVQTPAESLEKTDAATHRHLTKTLEVARQLGGIPPGVQGTRRGEHHRHVREGVWDHAHRAGPHPAPLVSPLAGTVGGGPIAAGRAGGGCDGGRYVHHAPVSHEIGDASLAREHQSPIPQPSLCVHCRTPAVHGLNPAGQLLAGKDPGGKPDA